jgi:uncharacterized membrane protein YidH (DUF202 family)
VTGQEGLDGEAPATQRPSSADPGRRGGGPAHDRGLAVERTSLAWHRTGLSLLTVGMAALRALTRGSTFLMVVTAVAGLGAMSAAGGVAAVCSNKGRPGRPTARPAALRLIAVCTGVMATAAVTLALLPSPG